jgi:hypothetical protein
VALGRIARREAPATAAVHENVDDRKTDSREPLKKIAPPPPLEEQFRNVQAGMFAGIDGNERETAPPSELELHPSNVVSLIMTFPGVVELDRSHCEVDNAIKRGSIGRSRRSMGKVTKGGRLGHCLRIGFQSRCP